MTSKLKVVVTCLMLSSFSAFGTSVKGNSHYGIGDGEGTWNFTSTLLGSNNIIQKMYDGGSSPVLALSGGNAWEQLDCFNTGAECQTGATNTPPYVYTVLFNLSSSIIRGKNVILGNLSGFSPLNDFFLLKCDQTSGNLPGGLCSNIPTTLKIAGSYNLKSNTLSFRVPTTLPTSITDLTFGITESQNGNTLGTFVNPTVAVVSPSTVPEPASMLLVGTGIAALAVRRRFKKAA